MKSIDIDKIAEGMNEELSKNTPVYPYHTYASVTTKAIIELIRTIDHYEKTHKRSGNILIVLTIVLTILTAIMAYPIVAKFFAS